VGWRLAMPTSNSTRTYVGANGLTPTLLTPLPYVCYNIIVASF